MFVADGGKSVEALLGVTGEPFRPEMAQYKDAKELGVYDMWQLHSERSELQRQYLEQWASIEGLDAILGKPNICIHRHLLIMNSAHDSLLQRTTWPFQIRGVHGRLQRGRLLCRVLPLWSPGRQNERSACE